MIENLNVTKTINVPIETVWHAISHIDHLDRWFSVIQHCQVEGNGAGAIRTLTLSDGGIIRDIIEEINHDKRQFCYRSTETPFPISQYRGAVNLSSTIAGKTDISWSAEYQVASENQQEMHTLFSKVFTDGINGLALDLQK